ncbi:MAG: hypothetical protein AAFZ01_02265 [Pseudomonadota bacterium]
MWRFRLVGNGHPCADGERNQLSFKERKMMGQVRACAAAASPVPQNTKPRMKLLDNIAVSVTRHLKM